VRRIHLVICAVVLFGGAGCVNLALPPVDGGGGGAGGTPDAETFEAAGDAADGGAGGSDGGGWETEPPPDAAPDVPGDGGPGDAPTEARSTLADGLVGYWKLDEAAGEGVAMDSSGNDNNGAITGSPGRVTSALPPVGFTDPGAFSFAGGSFSSGGAVDAIAVPDGMGGTLHPQAITIALWVRFKDLAASGTCGAASSAMQYLVHRRNKRGSAGMFEGIALIKDVNNKLTLLLSVASSGAQTNLPSNTVLGSGDVGKWFHVAATYDGSSRLRMYVNGRFESLLPYSQPIDYDLSHPLFIGRTGECGASGDATWDAGLNGALDDVRIYDRELTGIEVGMLAGGSG
jgi:hypothetical protein